MAITTKPVSVTYASKNSKIGYCASTGLAQATCPPSCAFRAHCMVTSGVMSITTHQRNRAAGPQHTAAVLAQAEADGIRSLLRRRPRAAWRALRIHTVGDAPTTTAAATIAAAASEYAVGTGLTAVMRTPSYGFTHAWRDVDACAWDQPGVSVLASCETPEDVRLAWARGYGAAIVRPSESHYTDGRAYLAQDDPFYAGRAAAVGMRLLPCPEQTGRAAACNTAEGSGACRLCLNRGFRPYGMVLVLAAHGDSAADVIAAVQARLDAC